MSDTSTEGQGGAMAGDGHASSNGLTGAVGFLTGLVVMETVLLIWLILERRRMKRELHHMTLLTVGVSTGNVNQASDFSEVVTESSRCPAMTILPTLARFHSRQLSSEGGLHPTSEVQAANKRLDVDSLSQARRSRSAGELTAGVPGADDFGEYACIRNSDVLGSVRRNRSRDRVILPRVPDSRADCKESTGMPAWGGGKDPATSLAVKGAVKSGEPNLHPQINQTSKSNRDLLRHKPKDDPDSDSDAHRYSLVRRSRLRDTSPRRANDVSAGENITRTPHISCELGGDLLREIATVTDITFEADVHHAHKQNGSGNVSKPSSGVYEDIQLSLPVPQDRRVSATKRQVSVASDDLTEISDLSSEASSEGYLYNGKELGDVANRPGGNHVQLEVSSGNGRGALCNDAKKTSTAEDYNLPNSGDYEFSSLARDSYNETLVGVQDDLLM